MAWRNIRFGLLHALRDAGVSALSFANAVHADKPADFLIDNRAGSLFGFAASAGDHYIQCDRGAGTLDRITRVYVPSGHNVNGADVRLRTADDAAFTINVGTILTSTPMAAGVFDEDTTGTEAQETRRYTRFDFQATGQWELGELIQTETRTLVRGPQPGYRDEVETNDLIFQKESGAESVLELGPQRRLLDVEFRNVRDAADRALFDEIQALGLGTPLLVDPPYDTEAVLWGRLVSELGVREDTQAPNDQATRHSRNRLRVREHLA